MVNPTEGLTAVAIKDFIFCNVMSYCMVNESFRSTCHLIFRVQEQAKEKKPPRSRHQAEQIACEDYVA
jgi:hypothetical protein